jgi:hypothetical protein
MAYLMQPTINLARGGWILDDYTQGIRNSQFAIRNSQFAIRNSQFAIRNSQFAIRNSQFAIC